MCLFLRHLRLEKFRNYENLSLNFSSGGVNWFAGDNGAGKTSILEAIYFLGLLRSFRTTKLERLICVGEEDFFISGEFIDSDNDQKRMHLGVKLGQKRELKKNSSKILRASEFINSFGVVSLVSDDIKIITESASIRRRFLDIFCSQIFPDYLDSLRNYLTAIKQRNAAIKKYGLSNKIMVTSFNQTAASEGAALRLYRSKVISYLNDIISNLKNLGFSYLKSELCFLRYSVAISEKKTKEHLITDLLSDYEKNFDRDIKLGYTCTGPHRDDLFFFFNNRKLSSFGSQGECRLAAIILKIASLLTHNQIKKSDAILLVDDVFGELDQKTNEILLDFIGQISQVFVASTHLPTGDIKKIKGSIFCIENGKLKS